MSEISVESATHKIIWCLTVFLLVCFLVFDTYSWGKYVLFIIAALIFVLSSLFLRNGLRHHVGMY